MALSPISQARAIALFNPTPGQAGFLQPLLGGGQGDNQSYVQAIAADGSIQGFLAVPWPERDAAMLDREHILETDSDSLWAFAFPGEAPLVLRWPAFLDTMAARMAEGALNALPLLAFDVVDTLDLTSAKRETYTRAYQRYQVLDRVGADHWRDRAILEPALLRALSVEPTSLEDASAEQTRIRFRARIDDERLIVTLAGMPAGAADEVSQAYLRLAAELPELFDRKVSLDLQEPRAPSPLRKPAQTTVVLVGRVQQGWIDHERWRGAGVEVIGIDHHRPKKRSPGRDGMTILLGVQTDWRELAEAGRKLEQDDAVIVTLSSTAVPLARDLDFQAATRLSTISFFAPFATSPTLRRDPVQLIAPLLDIFSAPDNVGRPPSYYGTAPHRLLMREPVRQLHDPVTTACRLAARAIRAGAVVQGLAELHAQNVPEEHVERCGDLLAPLFKVTEPSSNIRTERRQPALLLLVERMHRYQGGEAHRDKLMQALAGLLEMRGWQIFERHPRYLVIGTDTRKFSITIVDGKHQGPDEDPGAQTPGLGRAPFVIVHVRPRREELLTGNRGQFLHVALEDIAGMIPETAWIWLVLRRQLLESIARPTLAALRLSTALIVEAIQANRIEPEEADWEEIHSILAGLDSERFVDFIDNGIGNGHALLRTSIKDPRTPGNHSQLIELRIEDDGPTATILD
jgi:hypothetical protein